MVFGIFLYKLFGKIGGYIVLFSGFSICIMILTKIELKVLLRRLSLNNKLKDDLGKPSNKTKTRKARVKSAQEQLELILKK